MCPYCFAGSSNAGTDPGMAVIENWLRRLLAAGGPFNLQLSGGEPTLRDDLPEIITLARALGFGFVQLNTNGLRLAQDEHYLRRLKTAGLGCVFLQFDGVEEKAYERIRGRALLESKTAALRHCAEQQMGVVLVPTLVPGVNTQQIGDIIRFAIECIPAVRAVHFQPVSYFGRYPRQPSDSDRITIPEVLQQIEVQTGGVIKASDLRPPSAENAHCSFQGKFDLQPGGELSPSANAAPGGCCAPKDFAGNATALVQLGGAAPAPGEQARRSQRFVARQWAFPETPSPSMVEQNAIMKVDALDAFLERSKFSLSISGMAFQDAWNLDLERLRDCFLHVAGPEGKLVPLCAYNLSGAQGVGLYRP
jgi:uncharacterized radical SAM superfamily Fe-S cluster-containing enzyme